ncbi:alpha/beta fold hydrolase [Nocardioides caeni]|uniref:Alpha/beta hydrolase n=1 Tax=Nocardioides caeni TaxID=574700 RepID=A0A4S8NJ64_9ACTN|nr:alpha/beta hydrolase [Nocardioides caeni]THV16161.1 alpha/beta hydrolase [Nocardioides caeni]
MLSHEVHGSGEPLVLVHGLTHRRQGWYPVLEHLTDHRTVVLFDLPGHGESHDLVVRDGDVQATLRAELVEAMDVLGLDRPHIAGNSLGGRIALEAAADGLVASATTLSPAAFWHNGLDFAYIRGLFTWLTASARLLEPVTPVLARHSAARRVMGAMVSAHPERIPPEEFLADVHGMRRAIPAMRQIFPAAEVFDRPIAASVPVTIAWAARDLILLPYQARIAERRMPHARHVRLPGCGHVPMADDPALVAQVLLEGSPSVEEDDGAGSASRAGLR